jgi:hypothetical protein
LLQKLLLPFFINKKLFISGAAAESWATDPDQNKKLRFLVFLTFITAGA